MPIHRPSAPLSVTDALFDGLPAFLAGPDYGSAGSLVSRGSAGSPHKIPSADELGFPIAGKPPDTLADYNPIHVFVLGIGDVMKGLGVSAAISAGWRFFVRHPDAPGVSGTDSPPVEIPKSPAARSVGQPLVMAWVSQRPPSGTWKIAAAFYGTGAANALGKSKDVESFVSAGDAHELHMLTVPSMNLEAFYLKAQSAGSDDIFIPFPNLSDQLLPGLNTKHSYTEAEFLAAIRRDVPKRRSSVPRSGG